LSQWDVSNVENMSAMFKNAISFNQPINSWNFNRIVNVTNMFEGADRFLENPDNYMLNTSKIIDRIIPAHFGALQNHKTRETLIQSSALQKAIENTGLSDTFGAVGDYIEFQNAGKRKTRKRRGRGKRNRKRRTLNKK